MGGTCCPAASAYNAFIDAAVDFRQRTAHLGQGAQPSFPQATIVLVRNDSGSNQNRLAVLGIDTPIIDPATNLNEFKNRVALSCVTPAVDTHEGKFVILAEPIAAGKIGRAYASGVCPVQIIVLDEDAEAYQFADIFDAYATGLFADPNGSASILWKEEGTGLKWAIVRFGTRQRMGVFPVELTQVGGAQGDEANPATWTYDVLDITTGETLESAIDPVAAPHKWQRPSIGQMIAATFGYAHYVPNDLYGYDLVLGWINEMVDQEACETASSST